MIQPIVLLFLAVAGVFAVVHQFAVEASLYWYYWWFDILMHFWGGVLIAFGIYSLATFRRLTFKPTLSLVFVVAVGVVVLWEVFEWYVGLFDPALHLTDALTDMFLGITGALIGYLVLKRFKI